MVDNEPSIICAHHGPQPPLPIRGSNPLWSNRPLSLRATIYRREAVPCTKPAGRRCLLGTTSRASRCTASSDANASRSVYVQRIHAHVTPPLPRWLLLLLTPFFEDGQIRWIRELESFRSGIFFSLPFFSFYPFRRASFFLFSFFRVTCNQVSFRGLFIFFFYFGFYSFESFWGRIVSDIFQFWEIDIYFFFSMKCEERLEFQREKVYINVFMVDLK